ncbi:MAG: UTRA domain-containing protein [Lachnospiraceae bacterium]|jgi:GntR family trehalose operon transcriptional repressor|nr:UTRA domain-containing protein [Lachnospiraceae bacterium]
MPKSRYEEIYKDLKQKIEANIFAYQELLPSENTLIHTYSCSRNTLRRAVSRLVTDGYVQTMQGKGVRNIYQPVAQTAFTIGEIESFRESATRNGHLPHTKVLLFTEFAISERQALCTGFPVGADIYYIQRLHYLDDMPLILNHNYFLKEAVCGLTKEIAEHSIYQYLEQTLHMTIVNSKRVMTVEKMTQIDEKYLMMNVQDYNCMAVVSSQTYNSDGVMFEYTQSRHRPDYFRFYENAVRKPV